MSNVEKIRERNYALDFLKIIATILIFVYHYQQVTYARFPSMNIYAGRFDFSSMVELFFLLSGFFICSYEEKIRAGLDFKTFIGKRVSRLLPVLAIVAVFFNFGNLLYKEAFLQDWFDKPITLWSTITSALAISQGWGPAESFVNYPMWYVSALLLCYCVFYLINYIAKRLELPTEYMYVIMIVLGLSGLTYGVNQLFYTYGTSRGYYAFFFGILLKRYLNAHGISKRLLALSSMVALFFAILFVFYPNVLFDGLYFLMTFFCFPAIIILMNTELAKKIFRWKFLGVVSDISFNVYVWHLALIMVLMAVDRLCSLGLNYSNPLVMFVMLALSFLVGTLSHYFIEIPIGQYVDKKLFSK